MKTARGVPGVKKCLLNYQGRCRQQTPSKSRQKGACPPPGHGGGKYKIEGNLLRWCDILRFTSLPPPHPLRGVAIKEHKGAHLFRFLSCHPSCHLWAAAWLLGLHLRRSYLKYTISNANFNVNKYKWNVVLTFGSTTYFIIYIKKVKFNL